MEEDISNQQLGNSTLSVAQIILAQIVGFRRVSWLSGQDKPLPFNVEISYFADCRRDGDGCDEDTVEERTGCARDVGLDVIGTPATQPYRRHTSPTSIRCLLPLVDFRDGIHWHPPPRLRQTTSAASSTFDRSSATARYSGDCPNAGSCSTELVRHHRPNAGSLKEPHTPPSLPSRRRHTRRAEYGRHGAAKKAYARVALPTLGSRLTSPRRFKRTECTSMEWRQR